MSSTERTFRERKMAGSNSVTEALFRQRPVFLAFLRARVYDEQIAQDLLQTAYLKLLTREASLRDPARAEAWFFRVLRNLVADHFRLHRRRPEISDEQALASAEAPKKDEIGRLCPCMTRELTTLRPAYSEALRTVDLDERTVRDFAREAGLSEGNALVRLHRARKALHARLATACRSCAGAGCLDCTCA